MARQVTEEMISALIDGELSSDERVEVEEAISTDESLRRIYEGYLASGTAVKESSAWVQSSVSLPADFTSRVMAQVNEVDSSNQKNPLPVSHESPTTPTPVMHTSGIWSVRTVIEVVAAVAAVVLIVVVWQGSASNPNGQGGTAKNGQDPDQVVPRNGVHALGSKNGEFKKSNSGKGANTKGNEANQPSVKSSRRFSIFVKARTRPLIDRFWITNDYEVTAPEGIEPNGNGNAVSVLLIDSKKADAVKFFSQLQQWDPEFQVFQQAKAGNASWLAPFDVGKADQSEGDFWTLQIVLISP